MSVSTPQINTNGVMSQAAEIVVAMSPYEDGVKLSDEVDENGRQFVVSSDGTTTFSVIREESGLRPAPIKLSIGYQDTTGKGYGLVHIEAGHGEQIRNAGFSSVEEFVAYVAQNYDEGNIRVGKRRYNGSITYLLQVTDLHDNTLFIELSKDGTYWNVNSAGIFRKGYSNKKETAAKTEPQQPNNAISTGSSLSEDFEQGITSSKPNGKPTVSESKDSKKTPITNGLGKQVIVSVKTPQINTNGVMSQAAEVVVAMSPYEEGRKLTHQEAMAIIAGMEEHAEVAPEMELTIENWDAEFGEDGIVQTPIGEVKMGEHQFAKMMRQGRNGKLGMVKPTLENPDVIVEDSSEAKEGDMAERNSSYVYVKTFIKPNGSRYYYFTSVTVSQGNIGGSRKSMRIRINLSHSE